MTATFRRADVRGGARLPAGLQPGRRAGWRHELPVRPGRPAPREPAPRRADPQPARPTYRELVAADGWVMSPTHPVCAGGCGPACKPLPSRPAEPSVVRGNTHGAAVQFPGRHDDAGLQARDSDLGHRDLPDDDRVDGQASMKMHLDLGVTQKTAWHLATLHPRDVEQAASAVRRAGCQQEGEPWARAGRQARSDRRERTRMLTWRPKPPQAPPLPGHGGQDALRGLQGGNPQLRLRPGRSHPGRR